MSRFFLLVVSLFLCFGCGKKGPLVYPDLLIAAAPGAATVYQVGQSLMLSFTLPDKDLSGRKLLELAGMKIMKRDSTPSQVQECSACTTDFVPFKIIYPDVQEASIRRYGNTILMLDGNTESGREYSYRVIPFTKDMQDGLSSKTVSALVTLPPPPPVLRVFSAPTEIKLEFIGLPSVDGKLIGYNIYRALKGEPATFLPLNKKPISDNRFTDSGLDVTAVYRYAVRSVIRDKTGVVVESLLSNEEEGALKEEE